MKYSFYYAKALIINKPIKMLMNHRQFVENLWKCVEKVLQLFDINILIF